MASMSNANLYGHGDGHRCDAATSKLRERPIRKNHNRGRPRLELNAANGLAGVGCAHRKDHAPP